MANFVCEADTYAQWCKGDAVQTHWWGPGGVVSARGYDKLAEVAKTGKGGYLLELWGDAVRPGEPVTRVEAQVRRRALREMNIVTAQDAIARAGQVWVYITGKWLRWAVPEVRTRLTNAPVDERWQVVQSAAVGAGAQAAERRSHERHAPKLDQLVPMMNGLLTSVGAALGVEDPDVVWRQLSMLMNGYRDDNHRDFAAEVRTRNLEFGPSAA